MLGLHLYFHKVRRLWVGSSMLVSWSSSSREWLSVLLEWMVLESSFLLRTPVKLHVELSWFCITMFSQSWVSVGKDFIWQMQQKGSSGISSLFGFVLAIISHPPFWVLMKHKSRDLRMQTFVFWPSFLQVSKSFWSDKAVCFLPFLHIKLQSSGLFFLKLPHLHVT